MTCRGICNTFEVRGLETRDWNDNPDLRRCSTCMIIIHRKDWVVSETGRVTCKCCKMQLSTKSSGKKARQKRHTDFIKKLEEIENENAVIKLSHSKSSYMKHLIKSYMGIRFFTYDMTDIAEYSIKQWMHRIYPIPDGYSISNTRQGIIFRKQRQIDILLNKIVDQNLIH